MYTREVVTQARLAINERGEVKQQAEYHRAKLTALWENKGLAAFSLRVSAIRCLAYSGDSASQSFAKALVRRGAQEIGKHLYHLFHLNDQKRQRDLDTRTGDQDSPQAGLCMRQGWLTIG